MAGIAGRVVNIVANGWFWTTLYINKKLLDIFIVKLTHNISLISRKRRKIK